MNPTIPIPIQYTIDTLLDRGCSYWENFGMTRIYLDENLIHLLLDIKYKFNCTGGIVGYTYGGKELTKLDYNRMLAEVDTKFFFDAADATYKTKDPCSYANPRRHSYPEEIDVARTKVLFDEWD